MKDKEKIYLSYRAVREKLELKKLRQQILVLGALRNLLLGLTLIVIGLLSGAF